MLVSGLPLALLISPFVRCKRVCIFAVLGALSTDEETSIDNTLNGIVLGTLFLQNTVYTGNSVGETRDEHREVMQGVSCILDSKYTVVV